MLSTFRGVGAERAQGPVEVGAGPAHGGLGAPAAGRRAARLAALRGFFPNLHGPSMKPLEGKAEIQRTEELQSEVESNRK